MKKLLYLLLLLMCFNSFGQLSENFDSSATLPSTWATFIGSNGSGTSFNWGISTVRNYSVTNSAFVRYEANSNNLLNEDWLVTPLVDLTNYSGCNLTFYGGQQYTDEYGTIYEVKISTTSQTNISSFVTIATFGESDFTTITVPALSSMKTIDLSAYNGQQIYVAFVMTQNDGDNWFIDNVNITGTLSTQSFFSNNFSIQPNPVNDIFSITAKNGVSLEKVQVMDINGRIVNETAISGSEAAPINVSDLTAGVYFVKIQSDLGIGTSKIIKK